MLFEYFKQAYNYIFANIKNTFLTMLSIIIGLCAVITIMTIGDTISAVLENYISHTEGANSLSVEITSDDEKYLLRSDEIKEIRTLIPEEYGTIVQYTEEYYAQTYQKVNSSIDTKMIGVNEEYVGFKRLNMLTGRFLDDSDNTKPVAVISDIAAKKIYGDVSNAVGENLRAVIGEYDDYNCKVIDLYVIGVYEYNRSNSNISDGFNLNSVKTDVYIPYNYMCGIMGIDDSKVQRIMIQVSESSFVSDIEYDLNSFMDERFTDERYEFEVNESSTGILLNNKQNLIKVVVIFFVFIASISLVVGGVGLTNTMLISVVNRTREIGIKKALGASNNAIRTQFLIESVAICLTACIIGVILSLLLSRIIELNISPLISFISGEDQNLKAYAESFSIHFIPSLKNILVTSAFSTAVGVIFGLYPANKGAKMQPVDALRFE